MFLSALLCFCFSFWFIDSRNTDEDVKWDSRRWQTQPFIYNSSFWSVPTGPEGTKKNPHTCLQHGERHKTKQEKKERERKAEKVYSHGRRRELITVSCLASPTGRRSPESATSFSSSAQKEVVYKCVCVIKGGRGCLTFLLQRKTKKEGSERGTEYTVQERTLK